MGDELLVYDLRTQNVAALNEVAARVWRASGGRGDEAEVARGLAREGGPAIAPEAMGAALDMLIEAGLVSPAEIPRRDRRDFLLRWPSGLAASAAASAPSVLTIVAPTPAATISNVCGHECVGATPYCSVVTKKCVQCLINAECTTKSAPLCVSGKCGTGGVL